MPSQDKLKIQRKPLDGLTMKEAEDIKKSFDIIEQKNAKLVEALEALTRDSIEMRNKAFKSRVERHTYRPIMNAVNLLGEHDIHVKWGKTLAEVEGE